MSAFGDFPVQGARILLFFHEHELTLYRCSVMTDTAAEEAKKARKAAYPIHPLILSRWSPRSMTGEPVEEQELMTLLEAARWAPSSYNAQPWRFVYGIRDTPHFDTLFGLLVEQNREWAKNAGALCLVISRNLFEHNNKPSVTHSFDAGAAWQNIALEGTHSNLVVHGMQGFDYKKAREACHIPEDYTVEMLFCVGRRAPKEDLPEHLQKAETPNQRKPLKDLIHEGQFTN